MSFPPHKAAEYERLAHAMQSGVAADQGRGGSDGSPKHLRVGVNSALVETAALGKLLVEKGVCTVDEYHDAIIEGMRAEVERYERLLGAGGVEVNLI